MVQAWYGKGTASVRGKARQGKVRLGMGAIGSITRDPFGF